MASRKTLLYPRFSRSKVLNYFFHTQLFCNVNQTAKTHNGRKKICFYEFRLDNCFINFVFLFIFTKTCHSLKKGRSRRPPTPPFIPKAGSVNESAGVGSDEPTAEEKSNKDLIMTCLEWICCEGVGQTFRQM